jgi:hypothetical protein
MKVFFTILIFLSAINLYGQIVVIEDDSIDMEFPIVWDSHYVKDSHNQFGFFAFIQVNTIFNDFSAFKTALGEHNIDFMNRSSGVFDFGIGGIYKKYLLELSFGLSNSNDNKNDSLGVKFNTTKYGIGFGYNLLNTKRFIITPKTSINWSRYRLINSTKERVNLEDYADNRDLDIRFNQLTGFVGLNISYKFYTHFVLSSNYWMVGLYGGYIFQFNDKPWVYSADKRLINNNRVDLKNYSFGMRVSWNIE